MQNIIDKLLERGYELSGEVVEVYDKGRNRVIFEDYHMIVVFFTKSMVIKSCSAIDLKLGEKKLLAVLEALEQ